MSPLVLAAGSKRQASPAPRRELMQANPPLTLKRQDSKAVAAPAGADVTDVTVSVSQLPVPESSVLLELPAVGAQPSALGLF